MKSLPIVLILGGIAIGGITFYGGQIAGKKSSDMALRDAIVSQQKVERKSEEEIAALRRVVLDVPVACQGVNAKPFYTLCDSESAKDWAAGLSATEKDCMLETFHSTNAHAHQMRSQDYTPEAPSALRMNAIVCDIAGQTYKVQVEWGDETAPASRLITAFHQERAEETGFIPPRSY